METVEMPTLKEATTYARQQANWLGTQIDFCDKWVTKDHDYHQHIYSYLQHMYEHINDAAIAISRGINQRPWRAAYDDAMNNYEMDKRGFLLIAESAL